MPRCREIPLPPDSLIREAYARPDYADAFRIELARRPTLDEACTALDQAMPGWVFALVRLRDFLVGWLGLKTSRQLLGATANESSSLFKPFLLIQETATERLSGADDKHLEFGTSTIVDQRDGAPGLIIATAVVFHHLGGRLYFAVVKPFHRVIMCALLLRAERRLR